LANSFQASRMGQFPRSGIWRVSTNPFFLLERGRHISPLDRSPRKIWWAIVALTSLAAMVEATVKAQNLDQIVLEVCVHTFQHDRLALSCTASQRRSSPTHTSICDAGIERLPCRCTLAYYHVKVRRHCCIFDKRDRPSFGRTGGYRHKYHLPCT
jgi:hypothetical protein